MDGSGIEGGDRKIKDLEKRETGFSGKLSAADGGVVGDVGDAVLLSSDNPGDGRGMLHWLQRSLAPFKFRVISLSECGEGEGAPVLTLSFGIVKVVLSVARLVYESGAARIAIDSNLL